MNNDGIMSTTSANEHNFGPHELFVQSLGTKKRGRRYILDGFDSEMYLVFDFDYDSSVPADTCDILIGVPGDSSEIRIFKNARQMHLVRLMFALGVSRFPENVRRLLYNNNQIVRGQ